MDVANEKSVLGNFDDATYVHYGATSTFSKRDGSFFVRTDGPDGELQDFEIAYVFGADPLQQYLIELPGGRYQVLGICWDTRPSEAGGQRWFHIYPNEKIDHDDELHWTGPNYTWNYMCAECHSTDLHKNYSLEEDRYETTWFEIDVSCEACHGPGSNHVAIAQAAEQGERPSEDAREGLVVDLNDRDNGIWEINMETGLAKRDPPRQSRTEIEMCARCHSRRSVVSDDYEYGRLLMDTHRPALLTEALYHADGQILDEVYVYGSFLQSKMYREGVTCKNCHDPHALKVRGAGNAVCAGCHLPEKFDTPSHHFHKRDSTGARCVECHMPARNYMVVDPRRDHSLRHPRPDLTVKMGTPNACTQCHEDRSAQWAADAAAKWWGPPGPDDRHYGEALYAGHNARPGAPEDLVELADDPEMPAIARATALWLLPQNSGPTAARAIERGLEAGDPMVRAAALSALEVVEPGARLGLAYPLLDDPIRGVRLVAVRALVSVPSELMIPEQRERFDRALAEYREAQLVNADRAEAHVNLAVIYQERGELDQAEASLKTAVRVNPEFLPAYVNLADLYRLKGRDDLGEPMLDEALVLAPDNADVHHALGLLMVRQKRLPEALAALGRASELQPDLPRYGYVYGVALQSVGEIDRALTVLKRTHQQHPSDRDILLALAAFSRESGSLNDAIEYARKLLELAPQDPRTLQLVQQLETERR
jgi:Flp pilus assembly protein TadD